MAVILLYVAFFDGCGKVVYTITIYSNRLYLNENSEYKETFEQIDNTIDKFSSCLFSTYNLCLLKYNDLEKYNHILEKESLHQFTKHRFELTDYYANTLVRLAEGKVKSQKSNNINYIQQKQEQLRVVTDKCSKTQEQLQLYLEFREKFIEFRKLLFSKPEDSNIPKIIKEFSKVFKHIKLTISEVLVTKPFSKDTNTYGYFAFEYEYLNPKIKQFKNQVGRYRYRINRLTNQITNLQNKSLKHCIFGSKKAIKQYNNGNITKEDFLQLKYKEFEISGRHDSKYGNWVFKPTYNLETNSFTFSITLINKTVIVLENIKFPYRQNELLQILSKNTTDGKMKPICFGIIRKYDKVHNNCYYQIKASFDVESVISSINYDKSTGIVAIDFNYGHLDMTELDAKGNLLNYETIYYDLNFNSKQNEISLRGVIDKIAEYACSKHKILAIENINTYKSNFNNCKDRNQQKLLNYTLHRLPYSKYLEIMNYVKIKHCVNVIIINPAFTSIIGRLKYANSYKLNNHVAASYVIGRRALGFKEHIPKSLKSYLQDRKFKSNWAKWSYLNKILK